MDLGEQKKIRKVNSGENNMSKPSRGKLGAIKQAQWQHAGALGEGSKSAWGLEKFGRFPCG